MVVERDKFIVYNLRRDRKKHRIQCAAPKAYQVVD